MRRSRSLHRRRNHRILWDDRDEEMEEVVVNNNSSNLEGIEINHPCECSVPNRAATNIMSTQPDDIPALLPPSFAVQQYSTMVARYIPNILHEHSRVYSVPPAFPTSCYNSHPPLLMANVPSMSKKY
jgi:hypothetical protein